MKKFVFSKVASLHAYSWQFYEQVTSFTGSFQRFYLDSKNAVLSSPCSPHVLTQVHPSPSNFEEHPTMFSKLNTCGKPCPIYIPLEKYCF